MMKLAEAKQIVKIGRANSKMPGTTYSIDAFACQTGSRLAEVPGTSCHSCYARRLQKFRQNVDRAWRENLRLWLERPSTDLWVRAATIQISRWSDGYHRWFDSGDLQSEDMFRAIVMVCDATQPVRHWLPTQEGRYVIGTIPDNLVVRHSAARVDTVLRRGLGNTSNVVTDGVGTGHLCPARHQGNQCGTCRACWNPDVKNVSYPKH